MTIESIAGIKAERDAALAQAAAEHADLLDHMALLLDADGMIDRVRQERDAAVADAERYRWLRDNVLGMDTVADPDNMVQVWTGTDPATCVYGKTLDAAIDAARKDTGTCGGREMSDIRDRFEAWFEANAKYIEPADWFQWMGAAWQAAEAQAARRCAEIADRLAVDYRAKYKGLPRALIGVRRGGSYDPHDDGISDGATLVGDAIRTEFPEAFK
jgi:hypothetical protein